MSSNPLVPPVSPDPVPGPDTPSPNLPPTPGPDTPPEPGIAPGFPPISPLSPAVDASQQRPSALTEQTAYPASPANYEQSPTTPPARAQGINTEQPSVQEPTYQPTGIGSPLGTGAPAHSAYPEAPQPYEQPYQQPNEQPFQQPNEQPSAAPLIPGHTPRQSTDGALATARSGSKAPAAVVSTVIAVALALVLGGAYYFLHAGGHVITAGGELAATAAGLHYENGHERIAFTAPGTWTRFPASTAQVMVRGEGCSFGLLEQRTLLSAQQLADAEAKDLHRRHPEAAPVISPRLIAGHEGLAFSGSYTDSEGQPMTQTYILVDRGANLLTMIETGTSASCPAAFLSLEDSLRI